MTRRDGGAADAAPPMDFDGGRDVGREGSLDARPTVPIRSILIASEPSEISDNAVRVGLALRDLFDARAEVLSVVPPLSAHGTSGTEGLTPLPVETVDPARRDQRYADVVAQLESVRGSGAGAPVTVEGGDPAEVIARAAVEHGAQLVTLGLRQHTTLDRVFRDETALRVMRRSPVPVLAVTPRLAGVPRHILVGMDFSRASVRVARAAAQLLVRGGTLIVAHVEPDLDPASSQTEGAKLVYSRGVSASFARLRQDLHLPPNVKLEPALLRGPAAPELLSLADRAAAEVIAVGAHRRDAADRLLLGSVTAALARDARCSMLVVGGEPGTGRE